MATDPDADAGLAMTLRGSFVDQPITLRLGSGQQEFRILVGS